MRLLTIAVISLLCLPVSQLVARIDPSVEPHMIDEASTRKLAQADLERARAYVQAQIDAALADIEAAETAFLEGRIRNERAKKLCIGFEERAAAAMTVARLERDFMAAHSRCCELIASVTDEKK